MFAICTDIFKAMGQNLMRHLDMSFLNEMQYLEDTILVRGRKLGFYSNLRKSLKFLNLSLRIYKMK